MYITYHKLRNLERTRVDSHNEISAKLGALAKEKVYLFVKLAKVRIKKETK